MARTNIVAQTLPGPYPALPLTPGSDLVEVAADVANGNETPLVTGRTVVVAHNSGAGARTVTITSVVDGKNRPGDITAYSIAAGKIKPLGPFAAEGWAHGGKLWIDGSHAEVLLAVITL